MSDHFASSYIGIPWKRFGRTPAGFDCWGLVMHVQRERFGVTVGDTNADGAKAAEVVRAFLSMMPEAKNSCMVEWERVEEPRDGDIVVMGNAHAVPAHCGVYLDVLGGGVLHCADTAGVVFQKVPDIMWQTIRFYRYKR